MNVRSKTKFDATMVTKVRELREKARITKTYMAEKLGYTHGAYFYKEKKGNFSLLEAQIIAGIFAEALNKTITIDDLI